MNIDRGTFSWYLFPSTQNSTRRQRMLPAYRTADEPFTIPQFALTRSDIDSFMEELRGFHTAFRDLRLSRFVVYCASSERRHPLWPVYGLPICSPVPRSSWISPV